MSTALTAVVIGATVVLAAWTALIAALDRAVGRALLLALAALEALLVVQLVIGVAAVVRGDGPPETVVFLAYLAGVLLVLPVATLWSLAERSRPSVLVLTLGCVGLAVMVGRMLQLWNAGG